ncbi:thiamine phosphate synthase [Adhaeribacter aquaticus]|uniref:thiamine phosphate synthase n=1 Tax=Adhaeribacter aquaticus TaxID=299567 RepID=UPI0003F62341|nr:thiamine phosphate synthase [Adhaeribacter aquaticus]
MISKLHYITQDIPGFSHAQLAEAACAGGVNWVQLRLKNKPAADWKKEAFAIQVICRQYNAKLIINDNVALAQEIGADGVHLGKQDMSTTQAREILGPDFIIGGTANTFEDIQMHVAAGVNYIGLGPFRFTATKENLSSILGLEGYASILKQCQKANITIPIIAIGGLILADIRALLGTGVYGIAVSSAIAKNENISAAAKAFIKALAPAPLPLES